MLKRNAVSGVPFCLSLNPPNGFCHRDKHKHRQHGKERAKGDNFACQLVIRFVISCHRVAGNGVGGSKYGHENCHFKLVKAKQGGHGQHNGGNEDDFTNGNIANLLNDYINPSVYSTTNQAKLNAYTDTLNNETRKALENNII